MRDNCAMTETTMEHATAAAQDSGAVASQLTVPLEFSSVGLSESLQRAVAAQGYTVMTPIQAKAIPIVLAWMGVITV